MPEEYTLRFDQLQNDGQLIEDQVEIEFDIGNHYEPVKEEDRLSSKAVHRWTAFVKLKDDNLNLKKIVKSVSF